MEPKIKWPDDLDVHLPDLEDEKFDGYTIDLNSLQNKVSMTSPYTVTGTGFPNAIWTSTGTATPAPWMTYNPNSASAKISLSGDEADVEVNGWSLVDAVKRIEQRLDLLQLNPALETEWEELRQLGEQYRQLEQHIREKQATFDRLKAMPAPDID